MTASVFSSEYVAHCSSTSTIGFMFCHFNLLVCLFWLFVGMLVGMFVRISCFILSVLPFSFLPFSNLIVFGVILSAYYLVSSSVS